MERMVNIEPGQRSGPYTAGGFCGNPDKPTVACLNFNIKELVLCPGGVFICLFCMIRIISSDYVLQRF
jgi:hypothetical protein